MEKLVREKNNANAPMLHEKRQSGELYQWKEEYKKTNLAHYYELSKKQPLHEDFRLICENGYICIQERERFVYFLDYIYLLDEVRGHQFGNLTPDYVTFIKYGLNGLKIAEGDSRYITDYNHTVESMEILVDRIIETLQGSKTVDKERKKQWFTNMKSSGAKHFDEAIQRVLFVNQIMWQTDHRLIGIGALDDYLSDFYDKDIKEGYLTRVETKNILKDFLLSLHDYYWLKSNMLMGDTGQIIVLGRTGDEGEYIYNELTLMIIEMIKELALPDPKILLRVNKNIPNEVLDAAIDCIAAGNGSPLLSNDDAIIPRLIEFGISKEDALRYTVSACWEPLIGGKSVSLNNMTTLNFMRPMENLIKRDKLTQITSFEQLLERYEFYLEKNLNAVKRIIDGAKFQYDTVMSVFIDGCKEKDASQGGAKYFNAGITTVALGNLVDSLLNIKKYVFEDKKLSLLDVKRIIINDYENSDDILANIKLENRRYGLDENDVIILTKKVISMVSKYTTDYRTPYGGRLKFGLSAPTYVDAAQGSNASFDGRRAGSPYLVHISNDSAESYTQVLNFSSALDYGDNRFNGNVVDLMINPLFIINNKDKIKYLIIGAINQGFFQMQANIVSSKILIDAMEHPENHQGLIVRVWGFSAYFNDLPDSYKKVLIDRALENEERMAR